MAVKFKKLAVCMFPAIFGLAAACERPFIAPDGAEAALHTDHGSPALRDFLDAAFGRDLEVNAEAAVLTRWCGPVTYRLTAAPDAPRRAAIARQIADLASTTGLAFDEVRSGEAGTGEAALKVILPADADGYLEEVRRRFPRDWRVRRLVARANCFFRYAHDDDGCIAAAVVVIPQDLDDERFGHCVAEELTQVMGLPADLDGPLRSVLASSGRLQSMTELDRTMLRLLYHPSLRPGMSRDEAAEAAERALEEIEAGARGPNALPAPG